MTNEKKISVIASCYKGEKYLPGFLENVAEQTIRDSVEVVLVHNDPAENELAIVRNFQQKFPGLVKHIVVPREPLAISMNRCIREAMGEYVCIWNIDDLRTPESLELQARVLDNNPNVTFTYGDFTIVGQWQKRKGRMVVSPEFDKLKFIQSFHVGPFYMWRKSACETIGYFDEQFLSGADFDFAVRLAVEFTGEKAKGPLGYYLDEGLGLSTSRATLQPIERTLIELRYGVFHKLDFMYISRAKRYRLYEVYEHGSWFPIDKLVPHRNQYLESRLWILYAIARYPFWLVQRAINHYKRKYEF